MGTGGLPGAAAAVPAGLGHSKPRDFPLQTVSTNPPEERKKKAPGEIIRYSRDFLMKFVQVRHCPPLLPSKRASAALAAAVSSVCRPAKWRRWQLQLATMRHGRWVSPTPPPSPALPLPARALFPQKYNRVPQELQYSNSDILLAADDPGREQQQQLLQRVAADEADERDWRSRTTLPPGPAPAPAAAGGQQQQQQQQQPGWRPDQQPGMPPPSGGAEAAKIQKATDIGRTAWHAGVATEGVEQTLRKVKGILNKLTPEKFERLLSQLIPMVSGYEVLQVRWMFLVAGTRGVGGWVGARDVQPGWHQEGVWRHMLRRSHPPANAAPGSPSCLILPACLRACPPALPACRAPSARCLRTRCSSPPLWPCMPTCAASWTPRCQSSMHPVRWRQGLGRAGGQSKGGGHRDPALLRGVLAGLAGWPARGAACRGRTRGAPCCRQGVRRHVVAGRR